MVLREARPFLARCACQHNGTVVSRRVIAHPPFPGRTVRSAAAAVGCFKGAAVASVQAFHTRVVWREDNASCRGRVEPRHVPVGQRARHVRVMRDPRLLAESSRVNELVH